MFSILFASHGPTSKAMVEAGEMICGSEGSLHVQTMQLCPGDSIDEFREKLKEFVEEKTQRGESLVVLTDLIGGTPYITACMLSEHYHFVHVTGTNMSVLIQAMTESTLEDSTAESFEKNMKETNLLAESIADVNDMFL